MMNIRPFTPFLLRSLSVSAVVLSGIFNQAWSNSNDLKAHLIPLDGIAAIVDDTIILKSELQMRTQEAEKELAARNILIQDYQQLTLKVLDNLILEKIQDERIQQLGLSVSDEEVFDQLQDIAEQNKLSLAELRDKLNLQEPDGFSKVREKIRQQMLMQKLREVEVISKTQVTEGEIDNYLQRLQLQNSNLQYHLQHIMVSLPENATPEQRKQVEAKAQDLLKRLQQGEDFTQLAVRYSNGNKALEGGDLGWLTSEEIPTFFIDTVEQLAAGQVSQLIRSPLGFHILKLLETKDKDATIVTLYDVHKFIILSDDALQKATPPSALKQVAQQMNSLAKFQELNQRYSDIPASVNQNGHLGWMTAAELSNADEKAIQSLTNIPGAAEPFATEQGWVILYVDATRQTDISLKNKRQQAMLALRQQKANESYEIWLRRLKEESMIENRITHPLADTPPENIEGSL